MARFFVGQLVRLVDGGGVHKEARKVIGMEGRIVSSEANKYDWLVRCYVGDVFANECCMEPILPKGHQPAELTIEELLPFMKNREIA